MANVSGVTSTSDPAAAAESAARKVIAERIAKIVESATTDSQIDHTLLSRVERLAGASASLRATSVHPAKVITK